MKKTIFAAFAALSLSAAGCGDEKPAAKDEKPAAKDETPAAKSIYQKCVDYYKKQVDCLLSTLRESSSDCNPIPIKDADFLNSFPPEKIEEIRIKSKDLILDAAAETLSRASKGADKIESSKNSFSSMLVKTEKEICSEFK